MGDNPIPKYEPTNFYQEDPYFSQRILRYFSKEDWSWVEAYFIKMGEIAAQRISPLVLSADQNPPNLRKYDAAGNRIDQVIYHESYREIARQAYEFGILGLGESSDFLQNGRTYSPMMKFGLGYLFSQSGSVLYCPICMTDGTIQLLNRYADEALKKAWLPRFTSMDMATFAHSGMYLTEAQGGSDVGANNSEARQIDGEWRLFGKKWFCSNAGSDAAMVLARPVGAPAGTSGLGLFLLPRLLPDGGLNNVHIDRIKPKLGTCEMATAEITMEGALAFPVGNLAKGFAHMTEMLNLSRAYNAIWSIGLMQRAYLEAKYYAQNRMAFGRSIAEYPLVAQTLNSMELASHQALDLTFEVLNFMNRVELGHGDENDMAMLRLLTPVIKFFTAEQSIHLAHQAVEIYGGNGCIEDFPVAKILRDAQILAIWEGTANILSLDLLRVVQKTEAPEILLNHYESRLRQNLPQAQHQAFLAQFSAMQESFQDLRQGRDGHGGQLACRQVAWKLAQFLQELSYALP